MEFEIGVSYTCLLSLSMEFYPWTKCACVRVCHSFILGGYGVYGVLWAVMGGLLWEAAQSIGLAQYC